LFLSLAGVMPAAKKSEIEMFVIAKVKQRREEAGLSQAELAFQLDVSLGFIGQAESHNHGSKYNLNHINRFAKIFRCSPKEFLPDQPLE
jgi:transcriptional regulator with XRE-family HTH domain